MIDIVLVILFCYQLHRMAGERSISPWPYVLNYLAIFFLMMIVFAYAFLSMFGIEGFKSEQGINTAMAFEPFSIMFEVFLFIWFRKKIQKTRITSDDHNDFNPPSPPKEKKDLSYFR